MLTALNRLLLATAATAAAISVSLWWFGARMADPARLERVAAAALADPDVRSFVTDQIVVSVASATGTPEGVVREKVAELDPSALAAAVKAGLQGAGIDISSFSKQLNAGGTSAVGYRLPLATGGRNATGALIDMPVLGVAHNVSSIAKWAAAFSASAAGMAFITGRRKRTLKVIGRAWLLSGGSVMAVAWMLPRFAEQRKGVVWAVILAWLDGGADTTLPIAATITGTVCIVASSLFRSGR